MAWALLVGSIVGTLSLIANPAICEVEEMLFAVTFAKVEKFKERVWQVRAAGDPRWM